MATDYSSEDRRRAARAVLEAGTVMGGAELCGIPGNTILSWKARHPEDWAQYTADAQADIEGRPRPVERTPEEQSEYLRSVGRAEREARGIFPSLPFLSQDDWDFADELWGFASVYLQHRYDEPKPIASVHWEWWAMCGSARPQVAIAAPRGHAKSTAITGTYVLHGLCTRRMRHLLLLGSNETLGSAFLHDIKVEIEENEDLARDYKLAEFIKESETDLVGSFKDEEKFRVIVKGAGQRMRGLKWERKRPDHAVADDMEDDEMVLNDQRRDKFARWFYGTVRPILKSNGKIRVVGTIVGYDSLLDRTMPQIKDKDVVQEPLRVYSRNPRAWIAVKYRAHDADFSHVLWPEQYSPQLLGAIRTEHAGMGKLDVYGQEYLNDPVDPTTAYFRPQDFLPMQEKDFETRKTYYAGADLAIGETERNAYTAMVVGGLDSEGFLNIVDVRRERLDGMQIVDEMFSIHSAWAPEIFRVESENISKAIGPFLYQRMQETGKSGTYINIDDKAPTKDKDRRGQSIRARMRAGKVRFNKNAEWYPAFEEELLKYPKFAYKDQFDAFAWLGLMLEEMVEPETDKELEEDEYREAFEAHFPQGRCETTGY
jgi:predicted phage terminase large subunit-like protein